MDNKKAFWMGVAFSMYREPGNTETINAVIERFLPEVKDLSSDDLDEFLMSAEIITEDEIIEYHIALGFGGTEEEDDYVPLEDDVEHDDFEWECPDCEEDNIDYAPKGEEPVEVQCESCGSIFKYEEIKDEDKE